VPWDVHTRTRAEPNRGNEPLEPALGPGGTVKSPRKADRHKIPRPTMVFTPGRPEPSIIADNPRSRKAKGTPPRKGKAATRPEKGPAPWMLRHKRRRPTLDYLLSRVWTLGLSLYSDLVRPSRAP
jgi:hypothetical protein